MIFRGRSWCRSRVLVLSAAFLLSNACEAKEAETGVDSPGEVFEDTVPDVPVEEVALAETTPEDTPGPEPDVVDLVDVAEEVEQPPPCEDQCVIGEETCQGSIHTKCEFDHVVGCAVPTWVEDCGAKGQECYEADCIDPCMDVCEQGDVGCQGDVAWFCTFMEGCFKKSAVADCSLVGQKCSEGQCVEEDGNPGATLGILCPDMNDCIIANCPNSGDPFCTEVALNDICGPQAQSDVEIQNFLNWNNCIQTNCQGSATQGQLYGCMRSSCIHEVAECYSGGVYGGAWCDTFDSCAIACPGGTSMVTYHKCLRSCANQVNKQGVEVFFNANYCMNEACLDQSSDPNCYEDAQYGMCYDDIVACYP